MIHDQRGQMTVELALVIPVVIVIAVIVTNAMQFFSLCAAFDRASHDQVRIQAASPAYGSDAETARAAVESSLTSTFRDEQNVEVSVARGPAAFDMDRFDATMTYHPTLFGLGMRSEVLGVPLPSLVHTSSIVIDSYKPGVLL